MPINETRTELQRDSQTIKQSQLLVKISQSNQHTVQFHRLKQRYHIDLSKVRYKLTNSSIERILHDNHKQHTDN